MNGNITQEPQFVLPVDLKPDEIALLIVDMQYNDASPEHGFCAARERWRPGSTAYYVQQLERQVIPTIKRLLDYFRSQNLTIVYLVLGGQGPDLEDMPPRVVGALVESVEKVMGVYLRDSYTEGSFEFGIIEDLAPRDGEKVIRKTTYGAFNSTNLDQWLREQGISSLVITGVTTSACVETTARDAADRGFGVVLVEEGTCDWKESYYWCSLQAFRRLFGDVATSAEDVIEALKAGRAVPRV